MAKKPFYLTKTTDTLGRHRVDFYYDASIRNYLLHFALRQAIYRKRGVKFELPDGAWVMSFEWKDSLVPGLMFQEG